MVAHPHASYDRIINTVDDCLLDAKEDQVMVCGISLYQELVTRKVLQNRMDGPDFVLPGFHGLQGPAPHHVPIIMIDECPEAAFALVPRFIFTRMFSVEQMYEREIKKLKKTILDFSVGSANIPPNASANEVESGNRQGAEKPIESKDPC